MQLAIWLFQPSQQVSWDPNKSLTHTIIVQNIQNIYIIFSILITTYIFIISFINIENFTHLHRILVGELDHNTGYVEHSSFLCYFDPDFDFDFEFD